MIESFFDKLIHEEILLFTTFTLDEVVLVKLLEEYKVNKEQRIVVYHDVLRHRNPGYLSAHYPNSTVITVVLKRFNNKNCPVFHSKIWVRILKINGTLKITNLVITSANLSQYHLVKRDESGTFESYVQFKNINLQLPKSFIFEKDNLISDIKHKRINERPETIFIDNRNRKGLIIKVENKKFVYELINDIHDTIDFCAGPFININALLKIFNLKEFPFKVYSESCNTLPGKKNLALHAKIILFYKTVVLGSANLTEQALETTGKKINHETILISKRSEKVKYNDIKKFQIIDINKCNVNLPGDNDPEEDLPANGKNWIAESQMKINAPNDAELVIENNQGIIKFEGNPRTNKVWVKSYNLPNEEVELNVRNYRATPNRTNKEDKQLFAKIISHGNVEIYNKKKIKWKVNLNYGKFWEEFDLNNKLTFNGSGNGNGKRIDKNNHQLDKYDVRDMRQKAIKYPEIGKNIKPYWDWLRRENIDVPHIPEWCQKLAKDLQNKK
jgi:hypothetical protein